jgi:LPXTG-motif cell wall-anchored protein
MKLKSFATTAGAAALALSMWLTPGAVQGQPMYDRIHVNLPYKIMLGEKTLEPGDYTIQQLPSTGGASRVLLFYTDNGMKFETSAMTIPALDINTARDTKVVLNHAGNEYYINKIWVQGKDYGYELPVPSGLKGREKEMTETAVAAQYQPTSENVKTETKTETAEEQKPTAPPPVTSETPTKPTETEAAQPVETPTPTPAVDANANTADRAMTDQDAAARTTPAPTQMPNTAANWLLMLLGGGTLSGAGLMLRRKR